MENESRIVELLSEMLHKFNVLTGRVDNLTSRVDNLNGTVDQRLGKVENEIIKLNIISAENSRALMKLGDNNDRINRLEKAVFK
jgi:hypothetical protein